MMCCNGSCHSNKKAGLTTITGVVIKSALFRLNRVDLNLLAQVNGGWKGFRLWSGRNAIPYNLVACLALQLYRFRVANGDRPKISLSQKGDRRTGCSYV